MKELFNIKNLPTWANSIMLLVILSILLFGNTTGALDGKLQFLLNNTNKLAEMQHELQQKDSLLGILQKNGQITYDYVLRQYQIETINQNKQNADFKKLNDRLSFLDLKLNQLNSSLDLSIRSNDSSFAMLFPRDTSHKDSGVFSFSDTSKVHLKLFGSVDLNTKRLDYHYLHYANYNITTFNKSNGWLTEPSLEARITSDDPNTVIGVSSFFIKPRRPKYSIGFGIGESVAYHGKLILAPSIGIYFFKPLFNIY